MQTIIVIVIGALAVWYLYRTFSRSVKGGPSSCGCGGCHGCPAAPGTDPKGMACERELK
jgi:hypothetical protein